MTQRIPTFSALLVIASLGLPGGAAAQTESDEGPGIIGTLMENLFRELEPELDQLGTDMGGLASKFGPILSDMSVLIDDLRNYQAPERLENGDIILRRDPDAPPPPPIGENLRGLGTPNPEQEPTMPDFSSKPEIEL